MPNPRQKVRSVAIKAEVTEALDPGSWTSTDVLPLTDESATKNFETQVLNEFGGSLDQGETILGGSKPTLNFSYALRGSGVAGTPLAPISALMKAGAFEETIRGTTIPAAAVQTVATATANTVTFPNTGTGTQWPTTTAAGQFGATAVLGEAVELAGNPAVPTWAQIIDYNVTGANITVTLSRNATDCGAVGAVFTAATTIQRLVGVKWRIYTPSPHPSCYAREYLDIARQDFSGGRPNIRATYRAASFAQLDFALAAQLVTPMVNDTTLAAPTSQSPPVGVNAYCTYSGAGIIAAKLAVSELTWDLGVTSEFAGNMNALQGFDPAVQSSRKIVGSINPILVAPGTRNLLQLAVNQTKGVLTLGWGPKTGYGTSFNGNRQCVTFPTWKFTDHAINPDQGTLREVMPGEATSFDNGLIIYEF